MNLFYGITLITKRQLKKLENHKKRENDNKLLSLKIELKNQSLDTHWSHK